MVASLLFCLFCLFLVYCPLGGIAFFWYLDRSPVFVILLWVWLCVFKYWLSIQYSVLVRMCSSACLLAGRFDMVSVYLRLATYLTLGTCTRVTVAVLCVCVCVCLSVCYQARCYIATSFTSLKWGVMHLS